MRNRLQWAVTSVLLAAQASTSFPGMVAASATSQTKADVPQLEVSINTKTFNPIVVNAPAQPDFATEVVQPLRERQAVEAKAQAEAAAKAAAEAAAKAAAEAQAKAQAESAARSTSISTASVTVASGDVWEKLRLCEAGGNYARNSGNGYYGAYQFDISTWGNYGGYSRPDLAPPAVQDAKAQDTQARRGWSPWPACSRKLGLR